MSRQDRVQARRDAQPTGSEYWPVVASEWVKDDVFHELFHSPNCGQRGGDWICTRDARHPLPHVALSGHEVVAVWDQLWYADVNHKGTRPTHTMLRPATTRTDRIRIDGDIF